MLLGNAKGYTKMVMARFKEIGYRPQLFLVNAADCGVPQRRERVFFCAIRDDIAAPPLQLAPKHRWISAGEATADLQILTDVERQDTKPTDEALTYWAKTKQGASFAAAKKVGTGKATGFGRVRNMQNAPSCTLTSNAGDFYHWSECRKLTYCEWKRLGSFPDDYIAKSDKIGKYMIGMSVPPKMTEAVAIAVIDQWLQPKVSP
jgi:DNA (cytosine-5)-methyltransferase 1